MKTLTNAFDSTGGFLFTWLIDALNNNKKFRLTRETQNILHSRRQKKERLLTK